jgi:hypothetical protein
MFSAAKAARLAKNALRNAKIILKMPISKPPCLVTRLELYCKGVFLTTAVTPLYSTRTEFSGGRHKGQQLISDWPLDDTRICS